MRILQLIDSLRPGGAEQMAVSYANAFSEESVDSHLCCSRLEGSLKKKINNKKNYIFLNRQSTFDLKAIIKLRRYIKNNKIDLIQAHGSSYFLGVLIKIIIPKTKLIWHDHLGARALNNKDLGFLKIASKFFDGIIVVNHDLYEWTKKNLLCGNLLLLKNFVKLGKTNSTDFYLKGKSDFNIICVANLRHPKDHSTLIKAFSLLDHKKFSLSLHLVGDDSDKHYTAKLIRLIEVYNLQNNVFIYGQKGNIKSILNHASIGVLSSSSEGLPVALLEYGLAGLPVVCTNVGDCKDVIGNFGKVVEKGNPDAFAANIAEYLLHPEEMKKDGLNFQNRIIDNYSGKKSMPLVIEFFRSILNRDK
ncbi:glycosyltransferase [uncultured Christiangramia sp.]|uniref:glycosyltransferase n=1 Tax=Christiangramia sp. 3-2217-3z TaxID=3417564 RepID=UPI0026018730|nr:glycosyltransferase [uncultured Christiangramia sp.]